MFEIERLQSAIKEQEYKYKEAVEKQKSYSIIKRMRERIKVLKTKLAIIELHINS
jgi:hypothetical protein